VQVLPQGCAGETRQDPKSRTPIRKRCGPTRGWVLTYGRHRSPQTLTPQLWTLNPNPETLLSKPSTPGPQHFTLNPQRTAGQQSSWRQQRRKAGKRLAQSVEPPWRRASRLQPCSGSAATEQNLCETVISTSKVIRATTLDCV
jgi:hypothetical protein